MTDLGIIVLAAGKGTRLNNGKPAPKPKVLSLLAGKPMLSYALENLKRLNSSKITIVIRAGQKGDLVKQALGSGYTFAIQRKQLGTAHAAQVGLKNLGKVKTVLITNGDDSAFYNLKTLKDLISTHLVKKNALTLLTLKLDNPQGLGRIIRDNKGKVLAIVEEKVASDLQKKTKEINVGCYIAEFSWLQSAISKIKKSKVGEYYLVGLVEIAVLQKVKVGTVLLTDRKEWQGVNTHEELILADKMMRQKINATK